MARSDYVGAVKEALYNTGLGEKPSLRRLHASPTVTVSGSIVTFILASGEGAKVKPGDVLCFLSENDEAKAYTFYVLSVSTDTVTAYNGYRGAPAISNASADMDGGVLEQNPLVPEHTIQRNVDSIFAKYLFPDAMKVTTSRTISSPDLSTRRSEINSAVEKIRAAYQIVGTELYDIQAGLVKDIPTAMSSTGAFVVYEPVNGSAIYLTTEERLAIGDEATYDGLVDMVSAGAAALCLSASVAGAGQERAAKDAQQRELRAQELWGAFLAHRNQWLRDVGEDNDFFQISLG